MTKESILILFLFAHMRNGASIIRVADLDMFRENLIENKHRKQVRSQRNGATDRDLKPNSKIRDDLNVR